VTTCRLRLGSDPSRNRRAVIARACNNAACDRHDAAIAVPAAAVAAARLIGGDEVAQSMPAGAAIFAGRDATCTAVIPNVEYHCVLDRPPFPEVQDFKGTVEATVDKTKHVNGGCRGLTSDGMTWQCYLGEEAVRRQIVSQDFLGAYAPAPGRG
jgi:hypothetical protein